MTNRYGEKGERVSQLAKAPPKAPRKRVGHRCNWGTELKPSTHTESSVITYIKNDWNKWTFQ